MRPDLPELSAFTDLLQEVWDSRMLSNFGPFAQRLEEQSRSYLGARHLSVVVSGDAGLLIALRALQLPAGAPCFLPSFTFNSTVNAAIWNGLTPVFVDIDPLTYTMSAADLAEACAGWSVPGVVLATHTFGNPCDHDRLQQLARAGGHALVYDAAHAYGSLRDGAKVGTLGDIEVFSLSGTKLVTSAEGGLVSTAHDDVAERLTYLRGYGFKSDYNSHYVGLNGKMSELHAALGILALAEVERAVATRRAVVDVYQDRLGEQVGWQQVRGADRSTYKDVAVWLGDRSRTAEHALTAAGVQTKRYFRPLHRMPAYARWNQRPLPVTDATYEGLLCVPAYTGLQADDIHRVCDVLAAAMAGHELQDRTLLPGRLPAVTVPAPRRPEDVPVRG
jgi:dTDP-4-amino-4,6-dideoxygalactose transaminase